MRFEFAEVCGVYNNRNKRMYYKLPLNQNKNKLIICQLKYVPYRTHNSLKW